MKISPLSLSLAAAVACVLLTAGSAAPEIPSPVRPMSGHELYSVLGTRALGEDRFSVGVELEIVESPDVNRYSFLLAYGATEDLDVWATMPYTSSDNRDAVGDLGVGIKYRVFHEGRYGPAFSLAAGLNLPTGQQDPDSVSGSLDVEGMLIGTKRLGPFTAHLNLGYTLVGESDFDDEVTAAVGLEFVAARAITFFGEVYSRSFRVPDTSDMLEWRIGYKVLAPGGVVTRFGLGFPFGDREPNYRILFGLSWNQGLQ